MHWNANLVLLYIFATTILAQKSFEAGSVDAGAWVYSSNETEIINDAYEDSRQITSFISTDSSMETRESCNPSKDISTKTRSPVFADTAISTRTRSSTNLNTWKTGSIIGLVVGTFLLLILLSVFFVYRKALMRFCCVFTNNDSALSSHLSYVPPNQETSVPENSGTSSSVSPIRKEFKELSSYNPTIPSRIANMEKNAMENRYRDVVPYDFNIVSLKSGNYVNASHIESSFIVTQDPIMTQVDDFWQMVWEHNVSVIVKLSNDLDDRTLPPAVYIPPKRWVAGNLEVIKVAEPRRRTSNSRRIIRLNDLTSSARNKVREIYHYHLEGWETNCLPPVRDFMLALQDIRKQKKTFDQIGFTRTLVHCGSGSGRTGAFIAIWLLLDGVDAERSDISVFNTVQRMRQQRAHVVNKPELYEFIYECLEFYKCQVTIPPSDSPYETVVGIGNSGGNNGNNSGGNGRANENASPATTISHT